ncbi:MAG: RagB/SusD family nutrient uptake outer membrane protein, partial [Tannerellaceae bacterium]
IELALEGFRFDDLMRWKRGELLEAPFNGLYVQALNIPMDLNEDGVYDVRFYSGDKPAAMTGVVDIQVGNDKNYSLSKGTYGELSWNPGIRQWEDKKYLYPIPEKDRLENPALGQNPGW